MDTPSLEGQRPTALHRRKIDPDKIVVKTLDDEEFKKRYVLWSPTKGVFLGDKVWSYDKLSFNHNSAITFDKKLVTKHVAYFLKRKIDDVMAVEVYPDLMFNLASNDAIANAGMPRWEYDKKKLPIKEHHKLVNINRQIEQPEPEQNEPVLDEEP